ncbi:MAG TPA: FAD-linked oxidase C-terminal domain-containing protein, partial [Anaerolineales bacterium]
MPTTSASPLPDLLHALERLGAPARTDPVTRRLYSTDASIYQIEPLGVTWPRSLDELAGVIEACAELGVPALARGSGSSLAGQAIGPALVVDCSRYLNKIHDLHAFEEGGKQSGLAVVEPGVILNALNRAAAAHGLQFGPDPASAERATLGGCLANNASGAHSIRYGMAADHLLQAEAILADGSIAALEEVDLDEAARRAGGRTVEAALYAAALHIREQYGDAIRQRWPRTWRRASGYGLNYLLPFSPSQPPQWGDAAYPPVKSGRINLAPLLAGSEGTLAVIRRATLRLTPLPQHTLLGLLAFPSLAEACEATPGLLALDPSAVELIPQDLIRLAQAVPAYARQAAFAEGLFASGSRGAGMLAVEFSGEDPGMLKQQAQALGPQALVLETAAAQRQVWAVRKVGLGLMLSRPGDVKPWSFIEDLAVPVERLGEFVRLMERILAEHGTTGEIYAHASAGCLHIRPLIELKTVQGVQSLRSIAAQAVELTLGLGGAVSGEHGDGLARSEWMERMYGAEIMAAFRELKQAADPAGLLNPGKILDAPPMDANLRFGPDYQAKAWPAILDFSDQGGLAGAVEQCNGSGVCLKREGVMCPSFQASGDEALSTRGRANLLRALISNPKPGFNPRPDAGMFEQAVFNTLDLCLACKGCTAECPSAVDMARLKYEFMHHYYRSHRRKLRDYLFGYIDRVARLGYPFRSLANTLLSSPRVARLGERLLGLAQQRPLPRFARRRFGAQLSGYLVREGKGSLSNGGAGKSAQRVLFLMDAFTEYFYPETGVAALRALQAAGAVVQVLPVIGAGRTLISKGFLEAARRQAQRVVEAVGRLDPGGELAVIGVEPSEIYTLRDEYPALLPGDERARRLAERAWMVDEYLVRPGADGQPRIQRIANLSYQGSLPAASNTAEPAHPTNHLTNQPIIDPTDKPSFQPVIPVVVPQHLAAVDVDAALNLLPGLPRGLLARALLYRLAVEA